MSLPTVCAVMLANGRPEMVKRAVASFRAQTYNNKRLLVYCNGGKVLPRLVEGNSDIVDWATDYGRDGSIGNLRNLANSCTLADVICHWDSDDWSHADRIAEQVALLQSSGAECVGYNEMLFWFNARGCQTFMSPGPPWYAARCLKPMNHVGEHEFGTKEQNAARWDKHIPIPLINCETIQGTSCIDNNHGEAWLYSQVIPNYVIGTSMCYWRTTWEKTPFPDRSEGCDDLYWATGDKQKGVSAVKTASSSAFQDIGGVFDHPRMIANIHGSNTCANIVKYAGGTFTKEWQRLTVADGYCRWAMKL